MFASDTDLRNVLELLSRFWKRPSWSIKMKITEILYVIAKLSDPLNQTRDTKCGRSHVDARHACAKAQRHSQDPYTSRRMRACNRLRGGFGQEIFTHEVFRLSEESPAEVEVESTTTAA